MERYDIALPGSALASAQPLIRALLDDEVRHAIEQLDGYDTTRAGDIQSLADPGGD